MPWDPEVYNKFKAKRYEPFYDLISHIHERSGLSVLDLGCGTGEVTNILADKLRDAHILGIDTSAEMLAKASATERISFALRSVEEQLALPDKFDLIVANASLQWVYNHHNLFPNIISRISKGGQLAVQMPSQRENVLNKLLFELVHEEPYYEMLKQGIHHSPVLTLDEYTQLLYQNGAKEVIVYQRVYPIISQDIETLLDFISGSALVPYMELLEESMKPHFIKHFKERIAQHFTTTPKVYAFKRILMAASV